jgi:hypothetical protein
MNDHSADNSKSRNIRISVGSVHSIRHKDLNLHYHCQHFVPIFLGHVTMGFGASAIFHGPVTTRLSPVSATKLKGQQFAIAEEVPPKAMKAMTKVSRNCYLECFQKL